MDALIPFIVFAIVGTCLHVINQHNRIALLSDRVNELQDQLNDVATFVINPGLTD